MGHLQSLLGDLDKAILVAFRLGRVPRGAPRPRNGPGPRGRVRGAALARPGATGARSRRGCKAIHSITAESEQSCHCFFASFLSPVAPPSPRRRSESLLRPRGEATTPRQGDLALGVGEFSAFCYSFSAFGAPQSPGSGFDTCLSEGGVPRGHRRRPHSRRTPRLVDTDRVWALCG